MNKLNSADPFMKMRLVPLDSSTTTEGKLEKYIRNYNPTVAAMANTYPHAYKQAKNKNYSSYAALAVQNAHRNQYKTLQRSLENGQTKAPLDVDGIQSLEDVNAWNIPSTYTNKFNSLQRMLTGHRASIAKTNQDELVIDGRTLHGTNYENAFKGLYVNTNDPPKGTRELVLKLRSLGIPKSVLSSKYARTTYGQAGSGVNCKRKRKHMLRVY